MCKLRPSSGISLRQTRQPPRKEHMGLAFDLRRHKLRRQLRLHQTEVGPAAFRRVRGLVGAQVIDSGEIRSF